MRASAPAPRAAKPKSPKKPVRLASTGVPRMTVRSSVPVPIQNQPVKAAKLEPGVGISLLDDEGYLRRPVEESEAAAWQSELDHARSASLRARLLIQLGEVKLGTHWPAQAQDMFDRAAALLPTSSPDRGLARFDSALSLFLQGRFEEGRDAFAHVASAKLIGVNRRLATLYSRHCAGCAGYHASHARLGIPEPTFLDPFCGVSAVAICLAGNGMRYTRDQAAALVPHNGEGSTMAQLCDSLERAGLTARMVSATEDGLKKLPRPLIAHVERDHFVAVVRADKHGVSYVCSDCGAWPGGRVDLDWKQWRSLDADQYVAVAKRGTAEALALSNLPTNSADGQGHVYLASTTPSGVTQSAEQILSALGTAVLGQTNPVQPPYTPICGDRGTSPHCVGGVNNCPISGGPPQCGGSAGGAGGSGGGSGGGGGAGGAGGGTYPPTMMPFGTDDPVNLATTEEEYTAQSPLTVYNPTGPSVTWTHSWYSLANVTPTGFGSGWTHPYNVRIEDNSAMPVGNGQTNAVLGGRGRTDALGGGGGTVQSGVSSYLVLPNTAMIQFTANSTNKPTASKPVTVCPVQTGYPVQINWCYNSNGTTYYVVIWKDRSQWTFQTNNGTTSTTGLVYPIKIADSIGNYINLNWSTFTYKTMDPVTGGYSAQGLVSIADSSGNSLLTVSYDSGSQITGVSDRYGRSLYYTVQNFANTGVPPYVPNQTTDELTQVSQIVPTGTTNPPVRFQYGYQNYGNTEQAASETIPYLHTISVPSATGNGMSTATINYNSIGEVSSTVDGNGNKTTYSPAMVNGAPQGDSGLVQVYNPSGTLVLEYSKYFNSGMSQTKEVNASGQTVWTEGYADPNTPYGVSSYTDGNGLQWQYAHDKYGNLTSKKTPKGVTTTYQYSYSNFSLGELTTVTTGSQTPTSYTYYEPSGLIETISSPIPGQSGTGSTQTTTASYDALGNLTKVIAPGNNAIAAHTTTYGYTQDGSYTQPEALGEPITVTDSLGLTTHLRYDSQKNLLSSTDPSGNQTTYSYNIANQLVTTTQPATGQTGTGQATTTNTYLYTGGPAVQCVAKDESGNEVETATSTYGNEGEVLSRSGAFESVSFTYDAAYHIVSTTDGNGNSTTYGFDLYGRKTLAKYPNANGSYDKIQFTSYDSVNHLLSRTNGNGQVVNLTYGDGDGLLSSAVYVGDSQYNSSITCDSYDRISTIQDSSGTQSLTHDDLGNITSSTRTYTGVPAQTFTYSYYPDGSRQTMVNPAGTWTYDYDADARYTSLTSPAGTSSASYYSNSWEASRTLPNGAVTNYAYNAVGKPTSLLNETSGATTLSLYNAFAYDGLFNLKGLTASVPGTPQQSGTISYTFNALNRLTNESSTRNGGYSESFGYDGAGNPTSFKGVTQAFNIDNQQTSPSTFAYDGDGNPTTYAGTGCTWDPENHLTGFGASWTAGYRADGLRAWKSTGGTTTYFLYDMGEPVIEMNSSGTITAVNVFAPDGLVARQQAGSWIQYTFDPQGNVAQRLNGSQAVLSSSTFDSFGTESAVGSPADPFAYNARSGYYFDRETGLYQCQQRYYDPSRGRWLNRDPLLLLAGTGLYRYCSDQPLYTADAQGCFGISTLLTCESAIGACIGGGVLGFLLQLLNDGANNMGGISNNGLPGDGCAAVSGCLSSLAACAMGAFCDENPLCAAFDTCAAGIGSAVGGAVGQALCDWIMNKLNPCYSPTSLPCLLSQAIGSFAAGCFGGSFDSSITTEIEDYILGLIGDSAGSAAGFGCSAITS